MTSERDFSSFNSRWYKSNELFISQMVSITSAIVIATLCHLLNDGLFHTRGSANGPAARIIMKITNGL